MSVETLPRHLRLDLDPDYVNQEFSRMVEPMRARHALDEPTQPLPLAPRSNFIPQPRQPIDDLPPSPIDPKDTITEARKPGKHRAPRASFIEWLGSSATRVTAVSMLGASLALTSAGSLLEDSLDTQTTYTTMLDEPAIVIPDGGEWPDQPALPPKHTTPPKNVLPKPHTTPEPTPTPSHKAPTPTPAPKPTAKRTPTPTHQTPKPRPTVTAKKPTVAVADHWPAPGTNCNYLPKHQHKASSTSAAQAKEIFKKMVIACWGAKEWPAAEQLWQHESNFRPMARNPNGGACGVVQALPCSKLLRASGANSLGNTTVEKQARWGVRYVRSAYGTPTRAWRHWRARVRINGRDVGNWY